MLYAVTLTVPVEDAEDARIAALRVFDMIKSGKDPLTFNVIGDGKAVNVEVRNGVPEATEAKASLTLPPLCPKCGARLEKS